MTYLQFHLLFIVPPLLLLARGAGPRLRRVGAGARRGLLLMPLVALVYTTPWDNYLVHRGVWSYGADRVIGTVGLVPLEEYLFFLLQPLLTGLWLYRFLDAPPPSPREGGRRAATAACLLLAMAGAGLLRREAGTYLGLILVWAAPVLALQAACGFPWLRAESRAIVIGVSAPTLYLWAADAVALHLGIWRISPDHTLGFALGPLPLEEAVFFLVTNLLVVQGLVLFLRMMPLARRVAA